MGLDLGKFFFRKADDQAIRLSNTTDPEIRDMTKLVSGAIEHGIPTAPRMPDDPGTGVSASVDAALASQQTRDLENIARLHMTC